MNDTISRAARYWGLGATALLAAALVAACGGGGSSSTATAQSYTNGPISGFGSIIVNGVRFDDSNARIEDEDGNSGSDKKAQLKLGTMVEVQGGAVDDSTNRCTATTIRFGSAIVGKVSAVDTGASRFTVLDQTVDVKPETVFDTTLTLATLADKVVEVHALFDAATGHYVATRVEAEDNPAFYKLRGVVSQLDKTARTLRIGAALISFASIAAADLPASFADGAKVRVRLQTAQTNGQWVAVAIRSGVRKVEDRDEARLIGSVTAFTSPTDFEVNGQKVDATGATVEGTVALGVRVVMRGTSNAGVIVATEVKVLRAGDDRIRGVELHGAITGTPDAAARTFVLRGITVRWDANTVFKDGATAAGLVEGAKVEVRGVLSTDQKTLSARTIEFET